MRWQHSTDSDAPGNGNGNGNDDGAGVGRTVLEDFRRGDLQSTLHRDLRDLYGFYLDEERRSQLQGMGRFRRWGLLTGLLLKALIIKLTPVRRLLLLLSLVSLIYGFIYSFGDNRGLSMGLPLLGALALLVILMLELMDKLLVRDELAVGRRVQQALLPDRDPQLAGWDISLFTRPANEVGGDLVDYLPTDDSSLGDGSLGDGPLGVGSLGVVLGDVSGKGLGAALLMAKLQATLRALATDCTDLADLGNRTNAIFCRDGVQGRFATLIYIQAEAASGKLRVLNAGHLPPILLKGTSSDRMEPIALPLGVARDVTYSEQRVELATGDVLLVYSDGLTEACNAAGEFFGEERLWALLPELQGLDAVAIGKRLLAEVERFVGEERPSDDLSLVVLKRLV